MISADRFDLWLAQSDISQLSDTIIESSGASRIHTSATQRNSSWQTRETHRSETNMDPTARGIPNY
eukprot:8422107-Pyramimonas_sp.AAC.1